jgi:hypothetical protein
MRVVRPRNEVQADPKRVGEKQMAPSSKNGAHSSKSKGGSSPPVWRMPFDAVEGPVSSSSESWVQSKTFMDGVAIAWRLQRRLGVELHRALSLCFGAWNIPSRGDVDRISNQVANVERQLRALRSELEQSERRAGASGKPRAARDRP